MGKRTPKMGIKGVFEAWKMSERSEKKLESTPHEEGFEKDPQFDLN
jgi:hypothetical protein